MVAVAVAVALVGWLVGNAVISGDALGLRPDSALTLTTGGGTSEQGGVICGADGRRGTSE